MKIMVTEGVCFIGSHVLRRRIESGKDAVIYDNLLPSDVEIWRCDCSRFREGTDWKPKIAFEDTMGDLLDYWRGLV